jgi:hypothetical protein
VSSRIIVAGVISALALFVLRPGAAAGERLVRPRTPEARHTLRLLTQARLIYKMNSQSYTATNPTLDRYYLHKVAEVDRLIVRLKRGRAVSLDAVDDALDSQDARRLGGHPMPIVGHRRF